MKYLKLAIPDELHPKFKGHCFSLGTSMQARIIELISNDVNNVKTADNVDMNTVNTVDNVDTVNEIKKLIEGIDNRLNNLDNRLDKVEVIHYEKSSEFLNVNLLDENNNYGNTGIYTSSKTKKIPYGVEKGLIIIDDTYTQEQVLKLKITPKHRLCQKQMGFRLGHKNAKNVPTWDKKGILRDPARNKDPEQLGWKKDPDKEGNPILYMAIFGDGEDKEQPPLQKSFNIV